jgi:hypothetical protein
MLDDPKERVGRAFDRVAMQQIEWQSFVSRIENDCFGAMSNGVTFQAVKDPTASTASAVILIDRHVSNLRFVSGVEVEATDGDW